LNVARVLADTARSLSPVSATPRLDAELLLAHALGISREQLLLRGGQGPVPASYEGLVARRRACEPIAYIVGHRAFWTLDLFVAPGVLIPRPDSETLIEAAIAHFGESGPRRVLDMGTGSGALLLAALDQWPHATGVGVDISDAALTIARANAERLGLSGRASVERGGWDAASKGDFDLVLCNPPYIETEAILPSDVADFEPASALFAGPDGLDDYRRIAPLLRLPAGGLACIEIGAAQARAVQALFAAEEFLTQVKTDLAGHDRCVIVMPRG